MKILVLSVTAGEGHNSMGKALMAAAKDKHHDAIMHDYLKDICPFRGWLSQPFYFFTLKHFPKLEQRAYKAIQNRDYTKLPGKMSAIHYMTASKKANQAVLDVIKEYQPDVVYCTHIYCGIVMSYLKKNGYTKVPSFFIVSDYNVIAYTEWAKCNDYILSPSEEVNQTLLKIGYKQEQILPFGITVNPKFAQIHDRKKLAQVLNIKPDVFTIFMSGGGTGFGNILDFIKKVEKNEFKVQIIIVNGHNEEGYARIQEYIEKNNLKNILNYGFVTNIHELMAVSDIMVGKLGGVGVTEAFNMGLPILCPSPAPFQEHDNGIYLSKLGCIINTNTNDECILALKEILEHPEKLGAMKQAVRQVARPHATTDLLAFMEKITYGSK